MIVSLEGFSFPVEERGQVVEMALDDGPTSPFSFAQVASVSVSVLLKAR